MATASHQSVSTRLADFVSRFPHIEIPVEVREDAKIRILDALGCALAAVATDEQGPARAVGLRRSSAGDCTIIGNETTIDPLSAAFVNGALVQAMDYDDTHPVAGCHISAVMVAATLAAIERTGRSGADALTCYVLGSEVTSRLGIASGGAFVSRGIHPTPVCGVFGAATVAGAALGLGASSIADALGLAGSQAAGILVSLAEGVPAKPLHAGSAARNGVFVAELAAEGARGPRGVFEEPAGLFQAFAGDSHLMALESEFGDLGERWTTVDIAVKAMPVCHYQQGALEAAKEIKVPPGAIESIEVGIDAVGIPLVLEPHAEKIAPRTTYQARFSLPYCTAVVLAQGHIELDDLTGAVGDPEVERLAATMKYFALPPGDRSLFAGEVIVHLGNGETMSASSNHPLGTPLRPMGRDDILAKYRTNATLYVGEAKADLIENAVLDLEHLDTLAPLTSLLRGRG